MNIEKLMSAARRSVRVVPAVILTAVLLTDQLGAAAMATDEDTAVLSLLVPYSDDGAASDAAEGDLVPASDAPAAGDVDLAAAGTIVLTEGAPSQAAVDVHDTGADGAAAQGLPVILSGDDPAGSDGIGAEPFDPSAFAVDVSENPADTAAPASEFSDAAGGSVIVSGTEVPAGGSVIVSGTEAPVEDSAVIPGPDETTDGSIIASGSDDPAADPGLFSVAGQDDTAFSQENPQTDPAAQTGELSSGEKEPAVIFMENGTTLPEASVTFAETDENTSEFGEGILFSDGSGSSVSTDAPSLKEDPDDGAPTQEDMVVSGGPDDSRETVNGNTNPALFLMPEPGLPDTLPSENRSRLMLLGAGNESRYLESGLPAVRNQGQTSLCWAFTTAAAMEISLRRDFNLDMDLSEEHLGYFSVNRVDNQIGNTPNDKNILSGTDYRRGGGSSTCAALFLSTWSGMDTEANVPFGGNPDVSQAYETASYLTEAVFSSGIGISEDADKRNDNHIKSITNLKNLIRSYGAVEVSIYADSRYFHESADKESWCYCLPAPQNKVNHAVTLVGWDDNYSSENFGEGSGAVNNGAFIARNSWGAGNSCDQNGLFYLSYDCYDVKNSVAIKAAPSVSYPNNYFYDGTTSLIDKQMESLAAAGSAAGTTAVANVFEVKAAGGMAEMLGEISIADYSVGNSYGIQIYTNLTDPTDPYSGVPAFDSPVTYTKTYAGIGTCPLPEEVMLAQGSRFSVVVTNLGTGIPLILKDVSGYIKGDSGVSLNWNSYVGKNQSFRYDAASKAWKDMSADQVPGNLRIKAHTRSLGYPVWITVSVSRTGLKTGETADLRVSIPRGFRVGSGGIRLSQSPTGVVTVTSGGVITAVKPGTVTLTCRVQGTAVQNSVALTVSAPPTATPTPRPTATPTPRPTATPTPRPTATPTPRPTATPTPRPTVSPTPTPTRVPTPKPTQAPALSRPASVKAAGVDIKKIRVTWSAVDHADGYMLYRRKGNGSWSLLKTVPSSVLVYSDTKVNFAASYRYRLRAFRKDGGKTVLSSYSSVAKASPLLKPVSSLKVSVKSRRPKLTWSAVSGASGYVIYRKKGNGSYKEVARVSNTSLTWREPKKLKKGKYRYCIAAFRTVKGRDYYSKKKTSGVIKVS